MMNRMRLFVLKIVVIPYHMSWQQENASDQTIVSNVSDNVFLGNIVYLLSPPWRMFCLFVFNIFGNK